MTTASPYLQLKRLRIMCRGQAVYDQNFHAGVNIIRGDNGSGKSTIADFIFFALGGEYEDWKQEARRCDEVQAEVETPRGQLVLKRKTSSSTAPVDLYFGDIDGAMKSALDGWEQFPLRRQRGGKESFSQVMFRSLLIPEAQSEGASNITMHQLLRLCYSDQRTPATRLFRFESFDTQNIREAVGDLICGISGYELYDLALEHRRLESEYKSVDEQLNALLRSVRNENALNSPAAINSQVGALSREQDQLLTEIDNVDSAVQIGDVEAYIKNRMVAQKSLRKVANEARKVEVKIATTEFELREIEEFSQYLTDLIAKLSNTEGTFDVVGPIEFTHCPACGELLDDSVDDSDCHVCKRPRDPDREKSRYNQIRLDLEIQTRETQQLLREKQSSLSNNKSELRKLKNNHRNALRDFSIKYSDRNEPRESYLAERTTRIGQIDSEIKFLLNQIELAEEIEKLSKDKEKLNKQLVKASERMKALRANAEKRRRIALTSTGKIAADLLREDLAGQPEFTKAEHVKINFITDSMEVDGTLNFAESSNVFLKNASILALFLASGSDQNFYHPSFLLMDNIEDKGMQEIRSHMFQRMIVEHATEVAKPFQVIFTTSMMNPELELDDYVIGPAYTSDKRSLDFSH